ncbi:MAG: type II CAAX endopeptidase family protein [Cyanobacteria bacterium P01_A01_bin.105]
MKWPISWTAIGRAALSVITVLVLVVMGSSLVNSWQQPQVTGQLQLYQSNLLLQASEWQGEGLSDLDQQRIRKALLGDTPLAAVTEEYQSLEEEAQAVLARSQSTLATTTDTNRTAQLQGAIAQQQTLLTRIHLRLGLLIAAQDDTAAAMDQWQRLTADANASPTATATATTLVSLWQNNPAPNTEQILQANLQGWFRNRALEQLYRQQAQNTALAQLNTEEQAMAQATLLKLVAISLLPTIGGVAGVVLLLALAVQWFSEREQALLAQKLEAWSVPWGGETIWVVLVLGFFFVGQFLLPLVLGGLGVSEIATTNRGRAFFSLIYYLLMSISGITVLFVAIRNFRPLPEGWFRFKLLDRWPLWGIGGYLVALPIMLGVSFLNQQVWQGQGGSNPLLQTVVEESDPIALLIFFLTAAVAAPLFEEFLFRGFLLPSLTRYLPMWGAMLLSSFIFAAAHLSLSEVVPLMTLGMILAFVYVRSRNLLSSMLLHSAWNSVTMVGLFLLGS